MVLLMADLWAVLKVEKKVETTVAMDMTMADLILFILKQPRNYAISESFNEYK